MPKSKTSYKRRMKQKKRQEKDNKWVKRKVAEFNALPEEAKMGLLRNWSFGSNKKTEEEVQ